MSLETSKGGGKDPNEEHDDAIARGKDHVPANISEGQNKPPPQDVPFKIKSGG